jgi:Fe-S cluster assembly iron-binding protein IscA
MFEITDLAASNLRAYLDQNKVDSAIRIALMQGGCSGPSLGLALDEAKASDKVFEEGTLHRQGRLHRCGLPLRVRHHLGQQPGHRRRLLLGRFLRRFLRLIAASPAHPRQLKQTRQSLPAGGDDHHSKEATMFAVTPLAVKNLQAYLEQNKISSAIRVALMQGG